jgi:hypothetical protein
MAAARKPFALPGTAKQYAPDLTAHVHHTKLVIAIDPVAKTLVGNCLTTIEPIYENQPISTIFFEATDLHIDSVRVHGESETLKFDIMDKGILVHLAKVLNKGERLVIDIKYNTLSPKLGIYFTGPTSLYPFQALPGVDPEPGRRRAPLVSRGRSRPPQPPHDLRSGGHSSQRLHRSLQRASW